MVKVQLNKYRANTQQVYVELNRALICTHNTRCVTIHQNNSVQNYTNAAFNKNLSTELNCDVSWLTVGCAIRLLQKVCWKSSYPERSVVRVWFQNYVIMQTYL